MGRTAGGWVLQKPANGFEPMAFALQKRCSTTELSRQWQSLGGNHLLTLSLTQRPEQQLGAALTAGFGEQARHMAFDRTPAEN